MIKLAEKSVFLKQAYSRFLGSKALVCLYFFIINLPLLIATFATGNWGDDYAITNLFIVKAKFSPILPLIFEPTGGHAQYGGHFAPFYNLINILIGLVSPSPVFFHLVISICYILTAFFIFLIVDRYYKDKLLGILAGTLFAVNYYIGFRAYAYNCFHSHLTNMFTGVVSVYFLIRYLQEKRKRFLAACGGFFLLTIFNYESGFVFLPVLIIVAFFSWLRKEISSKRLILTLTAFSLIFTLFFAGAYLSTGKAVPLSYRFKTGSSQWRRSIRKYAFNANELFINSTGLSILYNKLIFNKLKENPELKRTVTQLVRENKKLKLKDLPVKFIVILSALAVFIVLLFIFVMVLIFTRIRRRTYLFTVLSGCLFLIYTFIFYRNDIANVLAVPGSIIIADLIISFLRDKNKSRRKIGLSMLGLYFALTVWTIADGFDDCYRKSFHGLSKAAFMGPDKLYGQMNKKIGRFAENGIILFTHDYRKYRNTADFERIGDMIRAGELGTVNVAVYYKEFIKTDIPEKYKDKTAASFIHDFPLFFNFKQVIVSSVDEARSYLKKNKADRDKNAAIYLSKDYKVIRLE